MTLSALWGGVFFLTEIALDELPPFTLILGRLGLAALVLLLLVCRRPFLRSPLSASASTS